MDWWMDGMRSSAGYSRVSKASIAGATLELRWAFLARLWSNEVWRLIHEGQWKPGICGTCNSYSSIRAFSESETTLSVQKRGLVFWGVSFHVSCSSLSSSLEASKIFAKATLFAFDRRVEDFKKHPVRARNCPPSGFTSPSYNLRVSLATLTSRCWVKSFILDPWPWSSHRGNRHYII